MFDELANYHGFRKVAIPATISSLLGITEPAVYGVLIPKKNLY
ncbi:hypothetical protein [Ligilactobacillus salivarius]|nr:hypothetical protein [Ligilactobacillus salivarius]